MQASVFITFSPQIWACPYNIFDKSTSVNKGNEVKQGRRRREECENNNRRRRNRTGHRILLLGSLISSDAKCHKELKKRIAMGKEPFTKRKELLKGELNRDIKKRMINALIWSVTLYGTET